MILDPACITGGCRTESTAPIQYRLGLRGGTLVLQGCYQWWSGADAGIEWRDIPTVNLDEPQADK